MTGRLPPLAPPGHFTRRSSLIQAGLTSAAVWLALLPPSTHAQGFAAYISPPRFEVSLAPGERARQVVEIQHVGREPGNYRLYTNDWAFGADGALGFTDELAPGSCRPWVSIEAKTLTLAPGERYRYRFELAPPAGTPARECRFALMVEGSETVQVDGAVSFPVGGRIGVIVYAAIGGASAELSLVSTQVNAASGQPVAELTVRNSGLAHTRLEGYVNATDAAGQRFELAPADLPILPGETRRIALSAVAEEGKPAPTMRFPLRVQGELEWGSKRLPLDTTFAP